MEVDNRHILLVEDNPDDIELTLMALEQSNILNEVVVAEDGEKALELLLPDNGGAPDNELPAVVLLDLNMPKVGGLEVLRRVRKNERTRKLPVVILTSSKEDQDIIRGYELGANSYIRKPVDFENFVEAVRQLGLYWLVLNEPPS
ncbi:response regulator [Balneolales bacterium ANBcel1]|nr:response regulator [Balneolales bacterium ANBcel1]